MIRPLRSLNAKLAATLVIVIFVVSIFYIVLTMMTTYLHLNVVDQSLNKRLAATIVEDNWLPLNELAAEGDFSRAFDKLMGVNPNTEIYLVDGSGRILDYSAPAGRVKLERISLAPVAAFLDGSVPFPIYGDDPRDPGERKVFSAAPVNLSGEPLGYVYVVLGGEAYRSVAAMFQGSYILRVSIGLTIGGVVIALITGVFSFNLLTRRLRRLAVAMGGFEASDFRDAGAVEALRPRPRGDEIDQVGVTFAKMSGRMIEQLERLARTDQARRELVMHLSHDLRSPLSTLQGTLETLLIKEAELSPEQKRRYTRSALDCGQRLGRMTGELFELATLDAFDVPLRQETFGIDELAQDVCQKYRSDAERRGVALETALTGNGLFVMADIRLMERVLENLIENAIKYTPRGGRVRLTIALEGERAVTRVADTGPGIPQAELPRIFDRFYRAEQHRGDPAEGTGLGLAIAQRILQLHDSRIEVESEVGAGTTFSFALPLAKR